jgi:hypothetical protein
MQSQSPTVLQTMQADHEAFMRRQDAFAASMGAFAELAKRGAITGACQIDTGREHRPAAGPFEHGKTFRLVHIGRGGWTGYHASLPGSHSSRVQTQHYGDTWKTHDALAPDTLVVDTTAISDERIVKFAVSGPMVDVDLPARMVSTFDGLVPWQDGGEFGSARGLHYVAVDVYATIARRFGADVYRVEQRS